MSRTGRIRAACCTFAALALTLSALFVLPSQAAAGPPIVPQTTITSGPSHDNLTTDRTPTFRFQSSVPGSTFECSIDEGAWFSCTSPYTLPLLDDGWHEFDVRATAGVQTDPTPAHRRFYVDHHFVPQTEITSGPGNGLVTSDPTPTFEFIATTGRSIGYPLHYDTTFACSVDGGAWFACTSPYTTMTLGDGLHTFAVRATRDGRTDQSPAMRTFHVDQGIPDTTITGGPTEGSTTSDDTPTFSFSSSHVGATFSCSIDGQVPFACGSPTTLPTLGSGVHSFWVAASVGGNTDPTPAMRSFSIYVAPAVLPAGVAATPTLPASRVSIATRGTRISGLGRSNIALDCSAGSGECIGEIRLVVRVRVRCLNGPCFANRTIADRSFEIASGDRAVLSLRLSNAALQMVRRSASHQLGALALVQTDANDVQKRVRLFGGPHA